MFRSSREVKLDIKAMMLSDFTQTIGLVLASTNFHKSGIISTDISNSFIFAFHWESSSKQKQNIERMMFLKGKDDISIPSPSGDLRTENLYDFLSVGVTEQAKSL